MIADMPMGEKALIKRIRRAVGARRGVVAGIGDDCAVLRVPLRHEVLVTTDFSLEGTHFRREWHPVDSIGHRCLARGLSDIAAMGGIPLAVFLSLALPRNLPQKWVGEFMRGMLRLAEEFGVSLAGGDTAESPSGVLADIVVVGSAPKGKAIRRSGARVGDGIYVTGVLGGAAAALDLLYAGRKLSARDSPRHFYPEPRVRVGKYLREKKIATAMIDISDGLSTDLAHICEESGVGAEVNEGMIPRAEFRGYGGLVDMKFTLHGGEDYELLFTVARGKKLPERIGGIAITKIGRITRGKRVTIVDGRGKRRKLYPQGWEHFKG